VADSRRRAPPLGAGSRCIEAERSDRGVDRSRSTLRHADDRNSDYSLDNNGCVERSWPASRPGVERSPGLYSLTRGMRNSAPYRTDAVRHNVFRSRGQGILVSGFGAQIWVQTQDSLLIEQISSKLPFAIERSGKPPDRVADRLRVTNAVADGTSVLRLLKGPRELLRADCREQMVECLESWLHTLIALYAQPWVFVHAGVVGWHRQAIVIPGRSQSGKSSLVAALVDAGAEYYSDEYAVFDATGRVHAYPKTLRLRQPEIAGKASLALVQQLDPRQPPALRVGWVIVTHYVPGAKWRPRPMTASSAALALLDNTLIARCDPARALRAFQNAIPGCLALKGDRGAGSEMAQTLLAAF